jgi:hypothetical protein
MQGTAGRDTIHPKTSGRAARNRRLNAASGDQSRNGSDQAVRNSTSLVYATGDAGLQSVRSCADCNNESCRENREVRK